MMKKVLSLILAAAMVFGLAACGNVEIKQEGNEISVNVTPAKAGGWTLNDVFRASEMSEDELAIFNKAQEGYTGMGFEPIVCLGHQVVAGLNHAYLCAGTPVYPEAQTGLYIVKIYQDLEGNATITDVEEFDTEAAIESLSQEEEAAVEEGPIAGGWTISEDLGGTILPGDSLMAFGDATADLAGASYLPIALLGTQVVAGTNFAILCEETLVTAEPIRRFVVIKIYKDLTDKCTITNVAPVDLFL